MYYSLSTAEWWLKKKKNNMRDVSKYDACDIRGIHSIMSRPASLTGAVCCKKELKRGTSCTAEGKYADLS